MYKNRFTTLELSHKKIINLSILYEVRKTFSFLKIAKCKHADVLKEELILTDTRARVTKILRPSVIFEITKI